jgi:hypothetical protein
MRKIVEKILAAEEATIGRIFSPKGFAFLGGAAIFGEAMHHVTEWRHKKKAEREERGQVEITDAGLPETNERLRFEEYEPLDDADFYSALSDADIER